MTLCKITTTGLLSYVFDPENKQFLRMTCHHCFVLLHFRKKIGEVRIIRRTLSGFISNYYLLVGQSKIFKNRISRCHQKFGCLLMAAVYFIF